MMEKLSFRKDISSPSNSLEKSKSELVDEVVQC